MNLHEATQPPIVNDDASNRQPSADSQPDAGAPQPDIDNQSDSDPKLNHSAQDGIEILTSLFSTPIKILKRIPRLSRVTVARTLANLVELVVS